MPPCFQKCTSLPQMPVAVTWIRHSPAAGDGMGASTINRSWAGLVAIARLVGVIVEADILAVVVVWEFDGLYVC